jgi:hypothetical protein
MMRRSGIAAVASATLVLAGCAPDEAPKAGVTRSGVVTFATFARVLDEKARIAEGLDIDGVVSSTPMSESCSKLDFTSPEGEPGIDNQFGVLLPTLEKYVGTENIGQLLATAIADGQLLILLSVSGIDDPKNDADVTFHMAAGVGRPLLDTQGHFIAYQTFGVDRETAPVSTLPGRIVDGTLYVGPGEGVLPVRVLDASFNLELHGVVGELEVVPDAEQDGFSLHGKLGGGLAVSDFKDIVKKLNIGGDAIQAATTVVEIMADLDHGDDGGGCRQISAALSLETTPAFVLDP